ncbi:hypothetical protein Isop_2406 [Isosphaera pallida ATCC 43644]|uniref:Rod shape-determining protein MreD n=1 Tax=Isosphaera pallida (strain ATCC 43644 / DSM 9630 / IS1B) TaxID=575540 RepID=E8QWT2_ISOPI|nr:DUF6580 family putative transport protein [Isosphaera pallida]ADV62982.1 hypothetical protein Isop_2406 [Isosphaera pallida ATCC 43644]
MTPDPQSPRRLVRLAVLVSFIAVAVLARLIPHPPNVTPIGAIALFGGATFADRRLALTLPLASLLISDLFLGFHILIPVVYGSFAVNVLLGRWLRSRRSIVNTGIATLAGSIQFFVVTNFACWVLWYPLTWEGLTTCYVAAIPFFQNTLWGDAVFVTVLFGGLALVEWRFPAAREQPAFGPA